MSWFSAKSESENVKNFYPVTSSLEGFGALTEKDTTWACTTNRGFQTETQTWYSILEDGSFVIVQVIWSYVGVFIIPATAQMTFKHYNPKTKKQVWKSVNSTGFKPNGQSCKSDQFEIKHSGAADGDENYTITASLDKNVQISVKFDRPAAAPGFKLGSGDKGGISTFGKETEDGKRDGFVVHRFHPIVQSSGTFVIDGVIVDAKGEAMFIHAIQGMRPDSLASRWNFAFFTTGGGRGESKLGSVRAIQMEVETTDAYGPHGPKSGRTKVNIGAIYINSSTPQPVLVVGQTSTPTPDQYPSFNDALSSAQHLSTTKDKDTGYSAPSAIEFKWSGQSRASEKQKVEGSIRMDKLGIDLGQGGLIEKVDVLAEIPYVIRKALAAVTGTKPYIYQYLNPATLKLKIGDEEIDVEGSLFNEATFVSL